MGSEACCELPPEATAYAPRRPSRSRFLEIRGLNYHLREWGPADGPLVVLLHGSLDSSASFQFLVDEMAGDWRFVAPDWRGHGLTDWAAGGYWQVDLLADLDALIDGLAPDGAVRLVAHSMGAGIATLYAGLRPGRVERLVILDALGNPLNRSPVRIVEMLTGVLDKGKASAEPRAYASPRVMAERLQSANRRLTAARALFLGEAHARPSGDGRFVWPHDPTMRKPFPSVHNDGEWAAIWANITAPVLALLSADPRPNYPTSHPERVAEIAGHFRDITLHRIPETGHNLHHDAPAFLARTLDAFLTGRAPRLD